MQCSIQPSDGKKESNQLSLRILLRMEVHTVYARQQNCSTPLRGRRSGEDLILHISILFCRIRIWIYNMRYICGSGSRYDRHKNFLSYIFLYRIYLSTRLKFVLSSLKTSKNLTSYHRNINYRIWIRVRIRMNLRIQICMKLMRVHNTGCAVYILL